MEKNRGSWTFCVEDCGSQDIAMMMMMMMMTMMMMMIEVMLQPKQSQVCVALNNMMKSFKLIGLDLEWLYNLLADTVGSKNLLFNT